MTTTRSAVLAGSWYPKAAAELAATVDGFLALADPATRPAGKPLLAVVPHAGHAYSGPTAGKLFGLLAESRPDHIFILAPNHRQSLAQVALSSATAFATPLGTVPVDVDKVSDLARNPLFRTQDEAHDQEHAIEILLPFLQRLWPDNPPGIIPLLVPMLPPAAIQAAGEHLTSVLGPDSLVLVSSDFTHFGAAFGFQPFATDIPQRIERLDSGAILRILAADGPDLLRYGAETGLTMCGLTAAAVALAHPPADGYEGALIAYSRSGDRDGDYTHSVSYASILISSGSETHA